MSVNAAGKEWNIVDSVGNSSTGSGRFKNEHAGSFLLQYLSKKFVFILNLYFTFNPISTSILFVHMLTKLHDYCSKILSMKIFWPNFDGPLYAGTNAGCAHICDLAYYLFSLAFR